MRGNWTIDYPKADRQFVQGVRRLTRIHTRSVEQVVDLIRDEIYNWPWIYAVEVGHWALTDDQAKKLRDYLLRGGFLMTDDFHGTYEWEIFMQSCARFSRTGPWWTSKTRMRSSTSSTIWTRNFRCRASQYLRHRPHL